MLGKPDLPSLGICLSRQNYPFLLPSMSPLAHVAYSKTVSSFSSLPGWK